MKNKDYFSLTKMLEYIDKIEKYTVDYCFEQFVFDEKTIDATVFSISQIGELVKNLSNEIINNNPEIQWNMIKGLRNRIVHDYEGINLKNIWYVIENDIPKLKNDLNKILKNN